MRPSLAVLLTALVGLSVTPYPAPPASAGCVAPWLSLDGDYPGPDRIDVVRGQRLTVLGRAFVDGCNDTGEVTPGCSGNDRLVEPEPQEDIELYFAQLRPSYTQVSLGTADAGTSEDDRLGWVTWTITVPRSAHLGGAHFFVEGAEDLRVRVVGWAASLRARPWRRPQGPPWTGERAGSPVHGADGVTAFPL